MDTKLDTKFSVCELMVNDDYFGECVKRNNAMPIKVVRQSEIFQLRNNTNNDNSHKYFSVYFSQPL